MQNKCRRAQMGQQLNLCVFQIRNIKSVFYLKIDKSYFKKYKPVLAPPLILNWTDWYGLLARWICFGWGVGFTVIIRFWALAIIISVTWSSDFPENEQTFITSLPKLVYSERVNGPYEYTQVLQPHCYSNYSVVMWGVGGIIAGTVPLRRGCMI